MIISLKYSNIRRFAYHTVLLLLLGVTSPVPLYAAPMAGSRLELNLNSPNGVVNIRFRYCPTGQLVRGEPTDIPTGTSIADNMRRQSMVQAMRGFYISETEMSHQQFQRLLGQAALKNVTDRMHKADAGWHGDDFPMRGVTVVEAVRFCESLRELDAAKIQGLSGLESRIVRLPTHDEWQYACRAIEDPTKAKNLPYFSNWPTLNSIPKDVRQDCLVEWKKTGESAPFIGTQKQVIRVIKEREQEDPIRSVEILSTFLNRGLGTRRSDYSKPAEPQAVKSGNSNVWNILNMHGNVSEWVIATNSDEVNGVWGKLLAGKIQTMKSEKVFYIAGGSYNNSLGKKVSRWNTLSIWGGYPMKDGNADSISIEQIDSDDVVKDMLPGFRVLLDRVLADDWLYVIRESSILDEKASLQEIKRRLVSHTTVVSELTSGREMKMVQARVQFYEALAGYRTGARDVPINSGAASSTNDSYFKHLQEVMITDAH